MGDNGMLDTMKGKFKEAVGNVTGMDDMVAQGKLDQAEGKAKEHIEDVRKAAVDRANEAAEGAKDMAHDASEKLRDANDRAHDEHHGTEHHEAGHHERERTVEYNPFGDSVAYAGASPCESGEYIANCPTNDVRTGGVREM